MEMSRMELMPGVWLNHLRSDQFNTACLSVSLLTQLQRETAAMNAALPFVLRRGTTLYGDEEALRARMDELHGVTVEPVVRRFGEIQSIGFLAGIPESASLPGKEDVLRPACELLGELLLHPATRGGLLLPRYVDEERARLTETLENRAADPRRYAMARCTEEMCCFEDFAVDALGSAEEMRNVRYQKLSKHYRALLPVCPVEIFYCGSAGRRQLAGILREALSTLPRGEIDGELGTEVRMNALEEQPREVFETLPGAPDVLVMGFRLGECMEDPDPAALAMFDRILGGSSSRLFAQLREKGLLDGQAEVLTDLHKGLLLLALELGPDKKDAAREAVLNRIEGMGRGEIQSDELFTAAAQINKTARRLEEDPAALEGYWLPQIVSGLDDSPSELAKLCEDVKKDAIAAIARGLDCDLIYFLSGAETEA